MPTCVRCVDEARPGEACVRLVCSTVALVRSTVAPISPLMQFYEPGEAGDRCRLCGREPSGHEACEYFHPNQAGGQAETCQNCGVGSERHHLCNRFTAGYVGVGANYVSCSHLDTVFSVHVFCTNLLPDM